MSKPAGPASSEGGPLRVLHALAVSLPHQNGYTVRSRYIVETVAQAGWAELRVVTSPFYPGYPAAIEEGEIAGVPHHRVPHPADTHWSLDPASVLARLLFRLRRARIASIVHRWLRRLRAESWLSEAEDLRGYLDRLSLPAPLRKTLKYLVGAVIWLSPARWTVRDLERWVERIEERLLLHRFARHIARLARLHRSDLIHAHSPFRTALPAIRAARMVGIPVVYEVRGMWEESAVASGRFQTGDPSHRHWKNRETEAMRKADAVVTIGRALADEVVSRGVDRERVFVVSNAVDTNRFQPLSPEELAEVPPEVEASLAELSQRLRGSVLGYVGSVREMEGVAELVRGAGELIRSGREVSVLVVGDGPERPVLSELAETLGIADRVLLPGRVPHDHVRYYYRLIDIFVVSRPDFPVTRTVTPLKPLEAMAMAKALLVSDLPALREMVEDGETGMIYRVGDPADLAAKAALLTDHPELLADMGRRARRWVTENRTWERSLAVLPEVYAAARAHQREPGT